MNFSLEDLDQLVQVCLIGVRDEICRTVAVLSGVGDPWPKTMLMN